MTVFPTRCSCWPAVVPWFFISTAVNGAAESLVEHSDLVTRVWFPRLLAPIAAVLAAVVDLLIGLLLLVPVMVASTSRRPAGPDAADLAIGLPFLVALAAGFWFAAANVLYRDVRYALPFLLQLWLFVSPWSSRLRSWMSHGGTSSLSIQPSG